MRGDNHILFELKNKLVAGRTLVFIKVATREMSNWKGEVATDWHVDVTSILHVIPS